MKTFFLTLASALLLLSSCGTKTPDAPQSVNVMTFNIRLDTESDSLNAWPHRRAEVGWATMPPTCWACRKCCPNR